MVTLKISRQDLPVDRSLLVCTLRVFSRIRALKRVRGRVLCSVLRKILYDYLLAGSPVFPGFKDIGASAVP